MKPWITRYICICGITLPFYNKFGVQMNSSSYMPCPSKMKSAVQCGSKDSKRGPLTERHRVSVLYVHGFSSYCHISVKVPASTSGLVYLDHGL